MQQASSLPMPKITQTLLTSMLRWWRCCLCLVITWHYGGLSVVWIVGREGIVISSNHSYLMQQHVTLTSLHSASSCLDHTKFSIQFQPWNCWGRCSQIVVGPPLFKLLQPEMSTDGVKIDWCDEPLRDTCIQLWRFPSPLKYGGSLTNVMSLVVGMLAIAKECKWA